MDRVYQGVSRSIPAWAGEPGGGRQERQCEPVYPRVGGGTLSSLAETDPYQGLSPRGRGNLCVVCPNVARLGSIPAWAGEPILG